MKKLLVFFFLGFFAVPTCSAQQMMIGVRGGVNFANEEWTNSNWMDISGRTFGLAGGQADYWFDRTWALSIQVLFDWKGVDANMAYTPYGSNGSVGSAEWTISYIEVPLLAKVSFGSGFVRPYLFAGPSIGFLRSNIETVHAYGSTYIPFGIGTSYKIDTTADITDSTNKIDLSIVGGAGISFHLAFGMEVFIDAGYAFGLINNDNYSWDKAAGISVYSRDIRLAAGVLFPLH